MKQVYILLICLLSFGNLQAQEILFMSDVKLNSVINDKRETLPIVNSSTGETTLFILDNRDIFTFLFDSNFFMIDSFATKRPPTKYNTLLGYSIRSETYFLFYTTDREDEFCIQSIGPDNKVNTSFSSPYLSRKEKFLGVINYLDEFYLLTVQKRSSILSLYTLKGKSLENVAVLDFSDFRFSKEGYSKLFDNLLSTSDATLTPDFDIQIVDIESINPLDITSKRNKLYYFNNHIYLTLDNDFGETKVIAIDLIDFSADIRLIETPKIESDNSNELKSNSYFFDKYLFQVAGSREELCFQIKDITNEEVLKGYRVSKDGTIHFANSGLIEEWTTRLKPLEVTGDIEKTKRALRKISNHDIGISAFYTKPGLEITIGSCKTIKQTYGTMPLASPLPPPHPYGDITPQVSLYNPTMFGYSSFVNTKSVYFKSLLNTPNFEHIPGTLDDNVFFKIRDFENKHSMEISAKSVFRVEDYFVLGYYDKIQRKYFVRRFRRN